MIRVLVADDSASVRGRIAKILGRTPGIAVTAEAEDGREAFSRAQTLKPDVILMDLAMPKMNGIQATERIMSVCPRPIIVVSSAVDRRERRDLLRAADAGAVAVLEKREMDRDAEKWERELVRHVRAAARLPLKSPTRDWKTDDSDRKPARNRPFGSGAEYDVVALGVSTGGPGVLARILKSLPRTFPLPILVVIHLSETQDSGFADWLNGVCKLDVEFAASGEKLKEAGGRILVAPPSRHTVVKNGKIGLKDAPRVNYCRPSVDTLFFSLACERRIRPIGILLTGMGRDGAKGLKAIKDAGGFAICQDESTSVVFGMPQAAVDIDAAHAVLPDYRIAEKILKLADLQSDRRRRE